MSAFEVTAEMSGGAWLGPLLTHCGHPPGGCPALQRASDLTLANPLSCHSG